MNEYGALVEWFGSDRENRFTQKKNLSQYHSNPPQIPHEQAWVGSRASAAKGRLSQGKLCNSC